MASVHITLLALVLAPTLACGAVVERTDDDAAAGGAGDDGMSGGGAAPHVDPEGQCSLYAFQMEHLEGCAATWSHVWCRKHLQWSIEAGCVTEALDFLECLAATCEAAVECESEERNYQRCHGTLNE